MNKNRGKKKIVRYDFKHFPENKIRRRVKIKAKNIGKICIFVR